MTLKPKQESRKTLGRLWGYYIPMLCRQVLTDLGPSFIKAGQVLASRPDIVREDYMEELCTLQDDVPPFPDQLVSFLTIPPSVKFP